MKKISIITFSLIIIFSGLSLTNSASAAPVCAADGAADDITDPACYESATVTVPCTWDLFAAVYWCNWNEPGWQPACSGGLSPNTSVATNITNLHACPGHCGANRMDKVDWTIRYYIYRSSCNSSTHWCNNTAAPAIGTTTATTNTCHYISQVDTWSACVGGQQLALTATWSTVSGTDCSNVPLVRSCGMCGPATTGDYISPADIAIGDMCLQGSETSISSSPDGTKYEWNCEGLDSSGSDDDVACDADVLLSGDGCTGPVPNGSLCSGDDSGFSGGVNRTLVSTCTDDTKCEYVCASGYAYDSDTNSCLAVGACGNPNRAYEDCSSFFSGEPESSLCSTGTHINENISGNTCSWDCEADGGTQLGCSQNVSLETDITNWIEVPANQ